MHTERPNIPDYISYGTLRDELFRRPVGKLSDDEFAYLMELLYRLNALKDQTDTEAWWFRYYR
jgi:hypothetical protein